MDQIGHDMVSKNKVLSKWSLQIWPWQTWSCQVWSWQAWSWQTWSCQTCTWHGLKLILKHSTRGLGLTFNLVKYRTNLEVHSLFYNIFCNSWKKQVLPTFHEWKLIKDRKKFFLEIHKKRKMRKKNSIYFGLCHSHTENEKCYGRTLSPCWSALDFWNL